MEIFVVLALVAAASVASADPIDWSQVVPVHDLPQFHHKYPQLTRRHHEPYKIIGGEEARPGQFPYMVSLALTRMAGLEHFCGGSLLSKEFVLTAAHCVGFRSIYDVTLIVGAHDLTTVEPFRIVVTPVDLVIHADWRVPKHENDIAVIRVAPIQFNDRIQPIRLPSRSQQSNSFAGESATSSGWGLSSNDNDDLVLRFVEEKIITNSLCAYSHPRIKDNIMCTSGEGGRGTCKGDSGGPLTLNENDGLPTQVGITSFGKRDCERPIPKGFTRLTFFLDWIEANTDVIIRP